MKAVDLPWALLKLMVEGDLAQDVKGELEKLACLKNYQITNILDFRR